MKHADANATMPRLALPSWRISREATLTELCTAFIDRSRAEGLSPATERYFHSPSWQRVVFPSRASLGVHRLAERGQLSEEGNTRARTRGG
jgi:hypothetical protein